MNLFDVHRKFPTDEAAEAWFIEARWPDGIACPKCGSLSIRDIAGRKPQPYRCRDCRAFFSVKTGTVMHGSKLGLRVWAIAFYLMAQDATGISSMKLHRVLGVTYKTAWFMAHRIRETWKDSPRGKALLKGPVEIDETLVGGREQNKHFRKKVRPGTPYWGKGVVAGVKDRVTGEVRARVVPNSGKATLHRFVDQFVEPDAVKYTDDNMAYSGLSNHRACNHSAWKWVVDGDTHTNGIESFWATLKRGYHGTYIKWSKKHLPRYVAEFEGRNNQRGQDLLDQMEQMVRGVDLKRLRYRDLVSPPRRHPSLPL